MISSRLLWCGWVPQRPARVQVRFVDDRFEGRQDWVPPLRLNVRWEAADEFRAHERLWERVFSLGVDLEMAVIRRDDRDDIETPGFVLGHVPVVGVNALHTDGFGKLFRRGCVTAENACSKVVLVVQPHRVAVGGADHRARPATDHPRLQPSHLPILRERPCLYVKCRRVAYKSGRSRMGERGADHLTARAERIRRTLRPGNR
jgi:hypothetical protein